MRGKIGASQLVVHEFEQEGNSSRKLLPFPGKLCRIQDLAYLRGSECPGP